MRWVPARNKVGEVAENYTVGCRGRWAVRGDSNDHYVRLWLILNRFGSLAASYFNLTSFKHSVDAADAVLIFWGVFCS